MQACSCAHKHDQLHIIAHMRSQAPAVLLNVACTLQLQLAGKSAALAISAASARGGDAADTEQEDSRKENATGKQAQAHSTTPTKTQTPKSK
jgi:translation elongation factor EF-Ts